MLIEPLPPTLFDAAVALWHEAGLTRPWNDPVADLQRAAAGPASAVLAGLDDGRLLATAMVGHDGHRGSVYYVAVRPDARGNGHGREIMRACEDWLSDHGIPKLNLMVRGQNESTAAFYAALGYGRDDVVVLSKRLD
jgi:ribosomal protein S18 acetylase RimI-like enzyme